jgi:hypothetical protein
MAVAGVFQDVSAMPPSMVHHASMSRDAVVMHHPLVTHEARAVAAQRDWNDQQRQQRERGDERADPDRPCRGAPTASRAKREVRSTGTRARWGDRHARTGAAARRIFDGVRCSSS